MTDDKILELVSLVAGKVMRTIIICTMIVSFTIIFVTERNEIDVDVIIKSPGPVHVEAEKD